MPHSTITCDACGKSYRTHQSRLWLLNHACSTRTNSDCLAFSGRQVPGLGPECGLVAAAQNYDLLPGEFDWEWIFW